MDIEGLGGAEDLCMVCNGKQWVIYLPMDIVCPCPECALDKELVDIEIQKNIKIDKDKDGNWLEFTRH